MGLRLLWMLPRQKITEKLDWIFLFFEKKEGFFSKMSKYKCCKYKKGHSLKIEQTINIGNIGIEANGQKRVSS